MQNCANSDKTIKLRTKHKPKVKATFRKKICEIKCFITQNTYHISKQLKNFEEIFLLKLKALKIKDKVSLFLDETLSDTSTL